MQPVHKVHEKLPEAFNLSHTVVHLLVIVLFLPASSMVSRFL